MELKAEDWIFSDGNGKNCFFRKKPIVVEARQFWEKDSVEFPEITCSTTLAYPANVSTYFINTLEGSMKVQNGDWIITGVQSEKYPCKDEIFRKTYDPVEQDAENYINSQKNGSYDHSLAQDIEGKKCSLK